LKTIGFLINSNIYIALAAVALALATQVQLGLRPAFGANLSIIFFATLFEYNFHRYNKISKYITPGNREIYNWVVQHSILSKTLLFVSLTGIVVSIFFVNVRILYLLVIVGLFTLLYSVPLFSKWGKGFRLQKIPGMKILMLTLMWTSVTVFVPFLQMNIDYRPEVILVFAERFTFIFAIAVPFDIRDMKADKTACIRTLPLTFGPKTAMVICNLMLFFSLAVAFAHYFMNNNYMILVAYGLSVMAAFIFINRKEARNLPYYYHGILDGCLILNGLFICLSYYL
jgi:4-hydroxybenzoate polyprenyltransferase